MHDAQRVGFRTVGSLKMTEQRRRMRKTRLLSQEAPHLDFRDQARFDVTIELNNVVLTDQGSTVRLLALNGPDPQRFIWKLASEFARRLKIQSPTRSSNGSVAAKIVQKAPDESRVGG